MTVSSSTIINGPYAGNDVTVSFSYTFRIEDDDDILIYETDNLGVQVLLAKSTHYTVSGVGVDAGGLITRVGGALPTNYSWYIRANYPEKQLTDFSSQAAFSSPIHEAAFDHLTFLIQQHQDRFGRSVRFSDSYSGGASVALPVPVADTYLKWNSTASGLENGSGPGGLELSGDLSPEAGGDFDMLTFNQWLSRNVGLTAGTTQTQLGAVNSTRQIVEVSTCANEGDGVEIALAVAGLKVTVINNGVAGLRVWPGVGDALNGGSVNAADDDLIEPGHQRDYVGKDTTNYYSDITFDLEQLHAVALLF